MRSKTWLVYGLLLLTTFFWSSNVVIGRSVYLKISPLELSFWRWSFASLMLLPFTYSSIKDDWKVIRINWRIMALLSFLGVSLFNSVLYFSARSTAATNIALIQTTLPLFVVMLNFLVFRRGVNWGMLAGIGFGLAGAFFVIIKGQLDAILKVDFAIGDITMLAAVLAT